MLLYAPWTPAGRQLRTLMEPDDKPHYHTLAYILVPPISIISTALYALWPWLSR